MRIEDTDVARTVPGALEGILEGLTWLGIDWDEGPNVGGKFGPYFQSQRLEIYQKLARELVRARPCLLLPLLIRAVGENARRADGQKAAAGL